MADQKISIIYDLKDRASKGFKSLKGSIIAAGAAMAGLVIVGKKLVDASIKQAKVLKQTDAVIKSTGKAAGLTAKEVNNMAKGFQRVTNFGDEVIQSGQNMLLTFTNIGSEVFPQATETMLDMATAMNGGVTPSSEKLKETAIQLGKALNDPILGATALRRVGVALTEQQTEQIRAFQESGDIMSAQKIIMKELAKEFGGSAKAQINSLEQLNNAWGDIKEMLGDVIVNALAPIAKFLLNMKDKFDALSPSAQKFISVLIVAGVTILGLVPIIGALAGAFAALGLAWSAALLGLPILLAGIAAGISMVSKAMKLDVNKELKQTQAELEALREEKELLQSEDSGKSPEKIQAELEEINELIAENEEIKRTLEEEQGEVKAEVDGENKNKLLDNQKKFGKKSVETTAERVAKQKKLDEERAANFNTTLGFMTQGMQSSNKTVFAIGKAASVASATIKAYDAFNTALASAPPPLNFGLAAATLAVGLDQVSRINSTQLQLAEGGIVPATNGGVNATIAEAGLDEAVIPLDDEDATARLGGGDGGAKTFVLKLEDGTDLGKGTYEIQQDLLQTGEITP